jgi:putative surface cell wall-binding protein
MAARLAGPRAIPLLAVAVLVAFGLTPLSAQPAQAAIALVQKGTAATGAGTSITATLPAATTAGNLLVATVKDINAGCATDNFSAPSGWVKAGHVCRGTAGPLELWYRPNTPAGATSFVFNTGSSGANSLARVSEWSGAATTSPLDQSGTETSASASTTLGVSTNGNIAATGELAVTAFDTSSGLSNFTPGSAWTSLSSDPGNGFDSDYRLNPSSGSVLSENPTSSPQTIWGAVIATFLADCAGGSLTVKSNSTLNFPAVTLNAYDRTTTATVGITADDESGSGAGWNLNATSTTFNDGSGHSLPTTATTITAGSASAASGNCSPPTNTVGYPVTLPAGSTPPTAIRLFNASAGTGSGLSDLSLTTRLAVPARSRAGSYSSSWTFTLSSGP